MTDKIHALERREIIIHTRMIKAAIYAARGLRCQYCDDTGDVASIDGEWRGYCVCAAGQQARCADNSPAKRLGVPIGESEDTEGGAHD